MAKGGFSIDDLGLGKLSPYIEKLDSAVNKLTNVADGMDNASKKINNTKISLQVDESSVNKFDESVEKISDSFKKLNNLNFNKVKKGRRVETVDISKQFGSIINGLSNVESQLREKREGLVNSIKEFYTSVEDIKTSYNKESEPIDISGMFNQQDVDKAYKKFFENIKKNESEFDDVQKEMILHREKLYNAFGKSKVKFESIKKGFNGDYSDLDSIKEYLKAGSEMVKLANQISNYNKKIGLSDDKYSGIDATEILRSTNRTADSIRKSGISAVWGEEVEKFSSITNRFMDIARRMTDDETKYNAFVEMDSFVKDIVAQAKQAEKAAKASTKAAKVFNKEVRNPESYIDTGKTKLSHLSKADSGYSVKARFDAMTSKKSNMRHEFEEIDIEDAFDKYLESIVDDNAATDNEYKYVGELANLIRNKNNLKDSNKAGIQYLNKLLSKKPELEEFYKLVLGIQDNIDTTNTNNSDDTIPSIDSKKVKETIEPTKELVSLLERAKELGIDTSGFVSTDKKDAKNINETTEALKELIAAKEQASKIDAGNVSIINQKSIYELAQERRSDVGAVGDDFNYDRDTLNRYASQIKELQKQISKTTDAKILDDLKKDLKEVQVDFVALYESANELYDFKLDKKGVIKESTRELYQSLVPQEDINAYYKKLASISFVGSSTNLDSELKNKIELIKKEKAILAEIREYNDFGDYGEEDSLSDKYYNETINGIKTMDVSYEGVLDTLTKIRDLEKEQYILHGQMNGLNVYSDEYKKLYGTYEEAGNQIKELEKSLPMLDMFIEKTDREVNSKTSDSDLSLYAKDLVDYSAQAKFELGEMSDVDYVNLIQSLSKITNPIKEIKQEVNLANKELVKLGDVYRAVRSQDLEFFDRNPDGTGAIWATSEKDLYKTLYTGHNQGKEYSAEMYARNPLVIDAKGQNFNAITYLGDGTDEASIKITEFYNRIQELTKAREESFNATGSETQEYIELSKQLGVARLEYDNLSKSMSNVYGTHWTDDFVKLAKANGYDALKIENVYDDTKQLATTYAVWSDEQVKNVQLIASGEEELLKLHNELTQANQTEVLSGGAIPALKQEESQVEEINEDLEKQSDLYKQIYNRIEKIRMLGAVGANKNDASDIQASYGAESRNTDAYKMQMEAIKTLSPTGEMNPDIRDMVLNSELLIEEVTKKLVEAAEEYGACKKALDDMFAKAGIIGGKVYDDAYRNLSMYSLDSEGMFGVIGETREKLALIKSENAAREEAKEKKEAEAQAQAELNKEKIEEARIQAELTRQRISGEVNQIEVLSGDKTQLHNLYGDTEKYLGDNERLISDMGLSYEKLIQKIQEENKLIKEGNENFRERVTFLNNGNVVESILGNDKNNDALGRHPKATKLVHTHPGTEAGEVFSINDMLSFTSEYLNNKITEFELVWKNQVLTMNLPDGLSKDLLGRFENEFGAMWDAVRLQLGSVDENGNIKIPQELKSVASKYINGYFGEMVSRLGGEVMLSKIDTDGKINQVKIPKLTSEEYKIIYSTLLKIKDVDFSGDIIKQIHDIKNSTKPLLETAETLYEKLNSLRSAPTDKNIKYLMPFLSDDDIGDLSGILSQELTDKDLRNLADDIYRNIYEPIKNSRLEALLLSDTIKANQTPLSSTSSNPPKKYNLANREDMPDASKFNVLKSQQEQQAYKDEVQVAEETAKEVIVAEQKKQKEQEKSAKAVEEKSERIRKAEQVVIDSIKNNEEKTLDQKIKAIEGKILTANQAIAGEKRTANDWKIKLPLYEKTLRLLKEQKAEENKISEEKRQQAIEQAKINDLKGEYNSNNYVINQKGLVGDEDGWSYTEQFGQAQTQRVTYRYDDDAGGYVESRAPEYTNFKGLTSAFKQGYESLRQMEYQLEKNKKLYGDSYDPSALERLIKKQREYVNQLLAEGKIYGRNAKYAMEYKQFVEDAKDIINTTKYKYQNKQNVDTAKEKSKDSYSPAYKAASDSLVKLDEIRKKLKNSNLDPKDYDDLINSIGKITVLEQECNDIKTQNKSLTKQEITDIKEKVRLIDNEAKARIEANKIATKLTASSQDDAKRDQELQLDGFIEKLKVAKFDTENLQKQAIALKSTLESVSDKKSLTDFIAKFKTLGYEFDYEQKKARSNNNKYSGLRSTIGDYKNAHDELNKLLGQEIKEGKSNELTAKIEHQKKIVEELKLEAIEASKAITQMFKSRDITKAQKVDAQGLLSDVGHKKTDSSNVLKGIRKDYPYAGKTKNLENTIKNILFGSVVGDSMFKDVSVDASGKTIITFLELAGNKARELKYELENVDDIITQLDDGSFALKDDFDFNDKESSVSKWRNRTKDDDNIIGNANVIKEITERANAYNYLIKNEDKYQKLRAKQNAGVLTKNQQVEFELLEKSRKRYNDTIEKTIKLTEEEKAIYNLMTRTIIGGLKERYEKQQEESKSTYNAYLNSYKITKESNPDLYNKIKDVKNNTERLMGDLKTSNIQGYNIVFAEAEKKVDDLNASLDTGKISVEKYNEEIKKVCQNLQDTIGVTDKYISSPDDIKNKLSDFAKSMGNVEVGEFNENTKTLNITIKENGRVVKEAALKYDEITGQIKYTNEAVKQSESAFKLLGAGLKNTFNPLLSYAKNAIDVQSTILLLRKGLSVIRELDVSLTEMRKVSDESLESLKRFQSVSFDVAGSIGTTAKQIQESSAGYMRLGYSLDTATKLAEHANIYANVGDMGIEEATEHMVSSIKAWESEFDNEIEASSAIVDRYNEIGNNFAITSDEIGRAMERSAAALKEGGNTLNESLGLITAGNIIQQDAETTANALKILSLRIRGAKTDLESMGEETDGLASSTSKMRDEIKALTGVDIMLDEENFKSTAQIIKELGAVWENLNDVSQAATLEKIAGKNRASTISGLLENYEVIDEVIKAAEGADNSALEENQRYLDSIEGKISQFTNEVQEFWYKLISSETVKAIVDFGTKAMDVIGDIVDGLGEVGSLITIISGYLAANSFIDKLLGHRKSDGLLSTILKIFSKDFAKQNGGGRDKMFSLVIKYATESFSREVCEFWCTLEW